MEVLIILFDSQSNISKRIKPMALVLLTNVKDYNLCRLTKICIKKKGDTPSILTDELFVSPCMLDRLSELLEARVGFGELWDKHYNQI